jgi:dihydrofolate reductase
MKVIAIVAASLNNVIGVDGKLPWNSPVDLANFQKETMGHTVLMGRKTWESLPRSGVLGVVRLPGRECHVLTKDKKLLGCITPNTIGCNGIWSGICYAVPELLKQAISRGKDRIFIIGGAEIFRQAFEQDLIDEVWLTRMQVNVAELPGTVYFPQEMLEGWPLFSESAVKAKVGPNYRFERYENPSRVKKEEPEMTIPSPELDHANEIIKRQQELLAQVVHCYMNDKPVSFKLACECAAYCDQNWDLVERPPRTGEVESPSPLAEEVSGTVGEQLKAALKVSSGIMKIENLTINIGK